MYDYRPRPRESLFESYMKLPSSLKHHFRPPTPPLSFRSPRYKPEIYNNTDMIINDLGSLKLDIGFLTSTVEELKSAIDDIYTIIHTVKENTEVLSRLIRSRTRDLSGDISDIQTDTTDIKNHLGIKDEHNDIIINTGNCQLKE